MQNQISFQCVQSRRILGLSGVIVIGEITNTILRNYDNNNNNTHKISHANYFNDYLGKLICISKYNKIYK